MTIRLNKDWRITSDPLQWIVQRRRTVKGEDRWEAVSFHGDFTGAVLSLVDKQVKSLPGEVPFEDLIALVHALDSVETNVIAAIRAAGLDMLKPGAADNDDQSRHDR